MFQHTKPYEAFPTVRWDMDPASLRTAKQGDMVIQLAVHGRGDAARSYVRLLPVAHATPKRLKVNGSWYSRSGMPVRKPGLGMRLYILTDPTPEVLAAMVEQERERVELMKRNEEFKHDKEINRRIAADWLAAQGDTEVIVDMLWPQTLDEVFDALRSRRVA